VEVEAAQFLRALRGRRSQAAFARRVGYRGNPITNWERGKRFPTAVEVLRCADLLKRDVVGALHRFSPHVGVAKDDDDGHYRLDCWLDALRADTSIQALARQSGFSRFSVRRWLRGEAQPRLPDFFRLVDAITGRLPEWVECFVPIDRVPSLLPRYRQVIAARRVAFDAPWCEAILRVIETTHYRARERHERGCLASVLGIAQEEEDRCLELLLSSGLLARDQGKLVATSSQLVDTQGGKAALRRLKQHWAAIAAARLEGTPVEGDLFAYNVISVSKPDFERIRDTLRATFREIRSLVAASEPAEVVAVLNLQALQFPVEVE